MGQIVASTFTIKVDTIFSDFVQSALLRAGYLYPACSFDLQDNVIVVDASDDTAPEKVERELRHLIYREKIYSETLGMRKQLIDVLTVK